MKKKRKKKGKHTHMRIAPPPQNAHPSIVFSSIFSLLLPFIFVATATQHV